MDRRLRFKASRPVYRRGGLLLSSAHWTFVEGVHALSKANALALVEDPVVVIEGEVEPDVWERPTAEDRRGFAENLRALIAMDAEQNTQAKPAAPAAGEGNDQVQTGLIADAGGAGATPPADVSPRPLPPPPPPAPAPASKPAKAKAAKKTAPAKSAE